MKTVLALFALGSIAGLPAMAQPRPRQPLAHRADVGAYTIPSSSFVLRNGLRVVVSPDTTSPQVGVELWVRAGARYEPMGQWGVAHFFEHLWGATHIVYHPERVVDGNAQTTMDAVRTWTTVRAGDLPYVLAQMADRLDYVPDSLTAARLERQRAVVINEYRNYETQPYGFNSVTEVRLLQHTFGPAHPYARVIQRNADIAAVTPADMQRFVATHVVPPNATLLLVGNTTLAAARPLVEHYFGPIAPARSDTTAPAASPAVRLEVETPAPTPRRQETIELAATQSRLFGRWATSEYGSADADYLTLFVDLLGAPGQGRLHRRLVATDRLASSSGADAQLRELAGMITASVVLRPDADPRLAEQAFDDEVERLARDGPTDEELARAKARFLLHFAQNADNLAWQGSRLEILAAGAVYRGDADAYRERLTRIANASAADVKASAQRWVAGHGYRLTALAAPPRAAVGTRDRTRDIPAGERTPDHLPPLQVTTLRNGLSVGVVSRHAAPLVIATMVIHAPTSDGPPNAARLIALASLDHDPTNPSGRAELLRRVQADGGEVTVDTDPTQITFSVSTLRRALPTTLRLLAALAGAGRLDTGAVQRALETTRAADGKPDDRTRARLILARAMSRSRPAPAVRTVTEAQQQHTRWMHPDAAQLIVVGDVTPEEVRAGVRGILDGGAVAPRRATLDERTSAASGGIVDTTHRPAVVLVDVPGRTQSLILAGQPRMRPAADRWLSAVLSRQLVQLTVYRNLRDAHHWAYDATASNTVTAAGDRALVDITEVQGDKTADAVQEVEREWKRARTGITMETGLMADAKSYMISAVTSRAYRTSGIADLLATLAQEGLPLDSWESFLNEARNLTPAALDAAKQLIRPDQLVLVVIADAAAARTQLEARGYTVVTDDTKLTVP